MKRLLITAPSSGAGKTTVTLAVLAALRACGIAPVSFKCGPDYLDPMFHREVSSAKAYNLDPFFLDGNGLRTHLVARGGAFAVIEGAMGYYDGIGATCEASAYSVARETRTPVVLVVGANGAQYSLAALISGFRQYRDDSGIAGVIFNGANESRRSDLMKIAEYAGVRMYGYLPRNEDFTLPSRYLGLLRVGEVADLQQELERLGEQAIKSIDIDGLIELAGTAGTLDDYKRSESARPPLCRIAVARDEAFCFLYEENLELLRELGCETVFFSPLRDAELPPDIDGLYLCGGYPELHAETLSANKSMLESIHTAVTSGLPTIAEGGGFMYLHMCGVISGSCHDTGKLTRFGYMTMTAKRDNIICRKGESIKAREFHYWDSDSPGCDFTAAKAGRDMSYDCVHATETMYAGFPQLYFPSDSGSIAKNFVKGMMNYGLHKAGGNRTAQL